MFFHKLENFLSCLDSCGRSKSMSLIWVYDQFSVLVSSLCPVYVLAFYNGILSAI